MADRNEAIIVTSSLTYVEIMEGKLTPDQMRRFEAFMTDRVEVKDPTPGVMRKAAELREHYYQQYVNRPKNAKERRAEAQAVAAGQPVKFVSLCTPDAVHVATALVFRCAEFHTYDRRRKKECIGLLPLVLPPSETMVLTRPVAPPPPPPAPPEPAPSPVQDSLFDLLEEAKRGERSDGNGLTTGAAEAGAEGTNGKARPDVRGSREPGHEGAEAPRGVP